MSIKKYEAKPISLMNLFWHIIMGWRCLLLWSIFFTILATVFAGISYSKAKRNYESEMEIYHAALKGEVQKENDEEIKFTKEELQQIKDLVLIQQCLNKSRSYMTESILMNVNPYAENKYEISFFVDCDYTYNFMKDNKLDYSDSLMVAYAYYVYNGSMAQELVEKLKLDCDVQYMQELLSVGRDEKTLTIGVIYKDAESFDKMSQVISDFLNEKSIELGKQYGKHKLKFVSEQQSVITDINTSNLQINAINTYNNYRSQYNSMKSSMTEQQLNQVKNEIRNLTVETDGVEKEEFKDEIDEPVYPTFNKRYPSMGFIGGFFFACVWLALTYIFNNKLESSHELTEYFDLKHAGTVFHDKKRKGLDEFLLKCRMRNQKTMDYDTSLDLVCSNVELMCQKFESKTICLTGTEIEKMEEAETIAEKLKQSGITVYVCGDVCYDQKAMRKIADVGTVVVLEKVGVSIYREIDRQLERLNLSSIQILGVIGVD